MQQRELGRQLGQGLVEPRGLDQGWVGVALDGAIVLVLLLTAATRERSPQRAVALFLIIYCLFASITETGMSNPSPYLLDLAVAASLILPPRAEVAR